MSESTITIFVCVSCRQPVGDAAGSFDRPGLELVEMLDARLKEGGHSGVVVTPVDCLAVCKRPCTVALSAADK